jgi:hypothetical protein
LVEKWLEMAILLRAASLEDLPGVVRLINASFARKKNVDYLRWQYFDARAEATLYCAFQGVSIIGTFGLQRKCLTNDLRCGQAIDMVVHQAFRGEGVFSQLAGLALSEFNLDLFCVFPNLAGKFAVEKGLGWNTVSCIPNYVLQINDLTELHTQGANVAQVNSDAGSIAGQIAFKYPPVYAQWRFDSHPLYTYTTLSGDEATSVIKVFTDPITGERSGDIVHMFGADNSQQICRVLNRSVVALGKLNVDLVTIWAVNHPLLEAELRYRGFSEGPQQRYFCLKVNRPDLAYLYNPAIWRVEQSDTEVF